MSARMAQVSLKRIIDAVAWSEVGMFGPWNSHKSWLTVYTWCPCSWPVARNATIISLLCRYMPPCPLKCYWRFQGVKSFGYTLHVTFILPTALGSGAWAPTRFLNHLPDICRNIGKHWCGGHSLKHRQTHVPFTVYSGLSWNFTTSFFAGKLLRITSPRSASLSRKMSESMWKNCWRPWLQPPAWKSVNGPCKLLPLGSKLRWLTPRKFMLLRMAEDVQANLSCIICLAVEHTRMTVRFVKVFLRLKSSGRNDPKRWHVGNVNQAVCMKLFWLLHWNLRWHRDCCPCHWYFPLIAWYGRILMADCAFPPHRKRHDLVAGSVIWEHCKNSAGKVSIRSYWHQI